MTYNKYSWFMKSLIKTKCSYLYNRRDNSQDEKTVATTLYIEFLT